MGLEDADVANSIKIQIKSLCAKFNDNAAEGNFFPLRTSGGPLFVFGCILEPGVVTNRITMEKKYATPKKLILVQVILILLACSACQQQTDTVLVARVGSDDINLQEFSAKAAYMGLGPSVEGLPDQLRMAVLQELIDRSLVLQYAAALGVKLDDKEFDDTEQQLRSGMELSAFEHNMLAQGMEYKQWRQELAKELLMRKTMELVLTPKIRVDKADIAQYHQEHPELFFRPEQILAMHTVLPSEQLARELIAKMDQGMSMAEAASQVGTPLGNDGRPDWLSRGHMPEDLENKIFLSPPGKPAGPFHSDYGYHVVWVVRKRPAASVGLAEASGDIQNTLAKKQLDELAAKWLVDLRQNADIWVDPQFLDSATIGERGK